MKMEVKYGLPRGSVGVDHDPEPRFGNPQFSGQPGRYPMDMPAQQVIRCG